eukprot:s4658_g7.t1
MQADFEHLSEETLSSSGYLDAVIEVGNTKAGVREEDDKRRAYKQAISDNQRHREETLAQFSVRRMRDVSAASNFGVVIPDALEAMLMREGAGLSDQSGQNLMAFLQGNEDSPDAVARALSRMDVRHDRLSGYVANENGEEPCENYVSQNDEASDDEEALDEQETLKELEPLDLTEDQVVEVFAAMEQRRRTWKQNKLFKADVKKDRGSFSKDGQAGPPRGQAGCIPGKSGARPRMNKEQLKKISKCRLCHERGHWAEDCVLRKKSAPTAFSYCGGGGAVGTAFAYVTVHDLREAVKSVIGSVDNTDKWAFLALPGGEAIVDIGATQDLIGSSPMEELTRALAAVGLKPLKINETAVTPSGIGGVARALGVMLLPISPGGVPGLSEITVLEGNIPPFCQLGQDDANLDGVLGGQPDEFHIPGQSRAFHQGIEGKCFEEPQPRGSSGGPLSSSAFQSSALIEPVCRVDDVRNLLCPHSISFQEISARTGFEINDKGNGIHSGGISDARDIAGAGGEVCGAAHKFSSCDIGVRGDLAASTASLQSAEQPVRPHDVACAKISSRTCSGPSSDGDAHAAPVSSEVRIDHAGDNHGGGSVVCGGGRDGKSQRRTRNVKCWPAWMLAAGVTTTSILLTWDQCSSELSAKVQMAGMDAECYLFQYDLAGVPGQVPSSAALSDIPAQECGSDPVCPYRSDRPVWLSSFIEARDSSLQQCSSLECPEEEDWYCLWRTVVEEESGEILENSPPSSHFDFHAPLDLWVRHWGLPMDFLRLCSFSDFGTTPLRMDLEGNLSKEGCLWAFSTELLSPDNLDLNQLASPDVGAPADLKRCGIKLSLLSRQLHGQDHRRLDFAELFSPPRVTPIAQKLGLHVDPNTIFDTEHGWDVRTKEARQKFRKFQKTRRPKTLMRSPVCKAFSPLQHLNHHKMCPAKLRQDLAEGHLMWDFSLEAAEEQCLQDDYFGLEHPGNATSWKLHKTQKLLRRADVALITFDMCAFGLSVVSSGELLLLGGLPHLAQEYPPALCQCIAQSARAAALHLPIPSLLLLDCETDGLHGFGDAEEEQDAMDLEEDNEAPGSTEHDVPVQKKQITEAQKRLVQKVHVNLGHPPRDRLLRAMRSAGALPHVLEYVRKDHECEDCARCDIDLTFIEKHNCPEPFLSTR